MVLAIPAPRRLLHQKFTRRCPACRQDTLTLKELSAVLLRLLEGRNSDLPTLPSVQDNPSQELLLYFDQELHVTGDQLLTT